MSNRFGFLDSLMLEMDNAERPNGWPGHLTGQELEELAPRQPARRMHTGTRPTGAHPWRELDIRRKRGTVGTPS